MRTARQTNEIRRGDEQLTSAIEITPDAVVLPDFFFGAYEALAVAPERTSGRRGDRGVRRARTREITAVVEGVRSQPIQTADIQLSALIYRTELQYETQRLGAEIWVDENHRAATGLHFPALQLDVARQDLALVSTRLTTGRGAGETDVSRADARLQSRGQRHDAHGTASSRRAAGRPCC